MAAAETIKAMDSSEERPVIQIAEQLCMDDFTIPPHFKRYVNCKNCGEIPVHGEFAGKGRRVVACPWCHTNPGLVWAENKTFSGESNVR